jgi:hypothetical protein
MCSATREVGVHMQTSKMFSGSINVVDGKVVKGGTGYIDWTSIAGAQGSLMLQ